MGRLWILRPKSSSNRKCDGKFEIDDLEKTFTSIGRMKIYQNKIIVVISLYILYQWGRKEIMIEGVGKNGGMKLKIKKFCKYSKISQILSLNSLKAPFINLQNSFSILFFQFFKNTNCTLFSQIFWILKYNVPLYPSGPTPLLTKYYYQLDSILVQNTSYTREYFYFRGIALFSKKETNLRNFQYVFS